ncbi:hypothetical protein ABT061_46215 [Streptosporangium sp. NPDC002544]|uniref:hypothetical protein n=1 Tax=Streptosporangium sp. NPDC002544 TaxID=3154538 RepID=UPI003329B436
MAYRTSAWGRLEEGAVDCEEEGLPAHVGGRPARFKLPRRITAVAKPPTTPSGKVQKFRLLSEPGAAESVVGSDKS